MRRALLVLALCLTACGGGEGATSGGGDGTAGGEVAANQNAPAPAPYEASAAAPARPPSAEAGRSMENPLSACGPADSYRQIAEYRCPDGTQPLGGDPMAGSRARVGNVGANSTGHIIDLYRVQCRSGDVDLYVDMYGCPEMQGLFGR